MDNAKQCLGISVFRILFLFLLGYLEEFARYLGALTSQCTYCDSYDVDIDVVPETRSSRVEARRTPSFELTIVGSVFK